MAQGAASTGEARAIPTAEIALAATLRCDVVAEGVQTGAELAVLMAESVRLAQGYLFSRPWREALLLLLHQRNYADADTVQERL